MACRRRQVLRVLIENGDSGIDLDQLISALLEQEQAEDGPQASDPAQLALTLHHLHLPKLAQAGIIEYDARSHAIRYHPDERIESITHSIKEEMAESGN